MAEKFVRIGSLDNVHAYDDGDYDSAIETDEPIKAGTPVDANDVIRLEDIGGRLLAPLPVADIDNPVEINAIAGLLGAMTLAYEVVGAGGLNEATLYVYDASGPAVNTPYIMDAVGGGSERWIAIAGKYSVLGYNVVSANIGGAVNYLEIDTSGILTLHGTAKRVLTLRPMMDSVAQLAHAKPTQVTIGVFKGYSFPIFAADDEQLFFREVVPGRWDGTSDIKFHALVCVAVNEDVDDRFQFRFSWEHIAIGSITPITSNDVDVEQIVLVGRNAQYNLYELVFTIDYDIDGAGNEIQAHELLAATLYRIAATASEIAGEVILLDWHTVYNVDKMFKAP